MLEKVLICLDGSTAAEQSLEYAANDSAFSNSKIVLLRIVSLPEITIPIQIPGVSSVPVNTESGNKRMVAKEKEASDYLEQIAGKLREKRLDVNIEALPGTPGEGILNYAQANDIKLIIIGTHGHNAARRFFLGSTADYVLHHSDIPVLTIRPTI